jgi:hypothetical protein
VNFEATFIPLLKCLDGLIPLEVDEGDLALSGRKFNFPVYEFIVET